MGSALGHEGRFPMQEAEGPYGRSRQLLIGPENCRCQAQNRRHSQGRISAAPGVLRKRHAGQTAQQMWIAARVRCWVGRAERRDVGAAAVVR